MGLLNEPSEYIYVGWYTCAEQKEWCPLETVNLTSIDIEGVYIIWHGGNTPRVVRVGKGNITERLTEHRQNPHILSFKKFGKLLVTWAEVQELYREGVEVYLENMCNPLMPQQRLPNVRPVRVNFPWD